MLCDKRERRSRPRSLFSNVLIQQIKVLRRYFIEIIWIYYCFIVSLRIERNPAAMHKLFKYHRAINSLLYSLKMLGGSSDMHKLCKILYFADQRQLSLYGRSITGDTYIAMQFGPVPSCIDDILKALRGDSFFSSVPQIEHLRQAIVFDNRFMVRALQEPDMDELSLSDVKCLDFAIDICRDKSFSELTAFSHGIAWSNTQRDHAISVKDILREAGDAEPYVEYIADNLKTQIAFL